MNHAGDTRCYCHLEEMLRYFVHLMSDQTPIETVCLASLMIDVQGEFANPKELKLRGQIQKAITAIGVGPCVGSGSGMGMMDMDFLVENEETARPQIERAMAESFPGTAYTLEFTQAEGKREDFLEGRTGCGSAAVLVLLLLVGLPLTALAAWTSWAA